MENSVQTLYNEDLKLFGFLQIIFERQGPEKESWYAQIHMFKK